MKTPPGRETTREILEQIVRGERGRQLRAKVAGLNSDVDRSRVDDAFQTACERAGKRCRGKTEGEVYQFLYTTMMRELNAVRNVLQREEPVDWSTESLTRFRRCDTSVAEEVVDREAQDELVELSVKVLDELTERQRAVAVLYSHGLRRKQIAAQLDITPRIVKRSLEQLLTSGRRRLIRMAGGGCVEGEALIARYAFGLGSKRDIQQAQTHMATCRQCGVLYERLDLWRDQVAATIPLPAVAGAHSHVAEQITHAVGEAVTVAHAPPLPDAVAAPRGHLASAIAHVREQAAGLYARTVDPTPLAGARPGAVAAAVAGCLAVGSGATYCVDQNVDLRPIGRLAGISSGEHKHTEKHRPPRARAAQPPVTTEATPVVTPPPVPVTTNSAPPPTTTETTPSPAPEDQFQPTSAGASTSSSTGTTGSTPTPKPKPAADDGAPEFGGP